MHISEMQGLSHVSYSYINIYSIIATETLSLSLYINIFPNLNISFNICTYRQYSFMFYLLLLFPTLFSHIYIIITVHVL